MTLHAPSGTKGKNIEVLLSRKDVTNLVKLKYSGKVKRKRKWDLNKNKTV